MENTKSGRSLVETIINEFSGIPGIGLNVVSPGCFELVDKKLDRKMVTHNTPISGIIRIIKRIPEISGPWTVWDFQYLNPVECLGNYETFYQVNEIKHKYDETYKENDILIGMLKSLFTLPTRLQFEVQTSKHDSKFLPIDSYINIGVRLGILLCGERRLETDCHFYTVAGGTPFIFTLNMQANDLLKKIENLENRNNELMTSLKDIHEKAVSKDLAQNGETKFNNDTNSTINEILSKSANDRLSPFSKESEEIVNNLLKSFESYSAESENL